MKMSRNEKYCDEENMQSTFVYLLASSLLSSPAKAIVYSEIGLAGCECTYVRVLSYVVTFSVRLLRQGKREREKRRGEKERMHLDLCVSLAPPILFFEVYECAER